jgi:catechol-2,3-dioxygenase
VAPTVYWDNGHYYEYVPSNQWWGNVEYDARQRTHQGLQGYLATVKSAEENEFIWKRSNNNAQISGNSHLGGQYVTNKWTSEW